MEMKMLLEKGNVNLPCFAAVDRWSTVHLRHRKEQAVQDPKPTAFK